MKRQNRQIDKQNGSALILVVVVTVLLAVIGVMFLMVSRASEMETAAVIESKDLDNAVDTIVSRINEVLVEDLFGNDNQIVDSDPGASDESYDIVSQRDPWLASLEPTWEDFGDADPTNDAYVWPRITDLYGNNFNGIPSWYYDPQSQETEFANINPDEWNGNLPELRVDASDALVKVIRPEDRTYAINPNPPADADWDIRYAGARADADGDGVADSRWVQVPGLTTSRGEPVFAAVRIIDNCAMLNLNTAHCFYQDSYTTGVSPFMSQWYATEPDLVGANPFHDNIVGSGRYLTEINYIPFLRGRDLNNTLFDGGTSGNGDNWYNIMISRGMYDSVADLPYSPKNCQAIFHRIENSISGYQFFDISDELELRNRYLVTSKVESQIEQDTVANYTLDSGNGAGGAYAALEVPRDTTNDFSSWKLRIDPAQFDKWDMTGTLRTAADPMSPYFYRYDRRHACTVYSYDRMFRRGNYPLLESAFNTLTAGWIQQQREQAERVFWPVGPVTTDIETPLINYKYDDSFPSILYPYAGPYNNVETRRKILHLLFAFREYFYDQNGGDLTQAAKRASQVVANIIDYSDQTGNSGPLSDPPNPFPPSPLLDLPYGDQMEEDCTFLTEDIIEDMISEVSTAILGAGNGFTIPFGLDPDPAVDIVFGYEKQPFISEIAADWNGSPTNPGDPYLEAFGLELVNPYLDMIDVKDWKIKIGSNAGSVLKSFNNLWGDDQWQVPGATDPNLAFMVLHRTQQALGSINYAPGGVLITDPVTDFDTIYGLWSSGQSLEIQLLRPSPQWVYSNLGIDYIVVDKISNDDVRSVMGVNGIRSLQRGDGDWNFIYGKYAPVITPLSTPYILGDKNTETVADITKNFQIGVADDGLGLTRWHELEVLGLYGNGPESSDPNAVIQTVSSELANLDPNAVPYFDLAGASSDLLDYIATINRPELGSLPGRININTAPVHVIAAAIPPTLADPNAADPIKTVSFSALQLAEEIVNYRKSPDGPFESLGELLDVPGFRQYDDSGAGAWIGENVGSQSIEDDIEEEHWILSNLANKFTVRSDVFTAYILVRLGEDGPQRRMIGIFDRSQVWNKNDRPKLVALHPVPDPR